MVIQEGKPYSFTFESSGFFQFKSPSEVKDKLSYVMSNNGRILSVYRPLFSARWIVVIIPSISTSLENFIDTFSYSWDKIGMDMRFVAVAEGYSGTSPGGIIGIPAEAGKIVGQTAAGTASGIFEGLASSVSMPLLIGGILLIGIFFFVKR